MHLDNNLRKGGKFDYASLEGGKPLPDGAPKTHSMAALANTRPDGGLLYWARPIRKQQGCSMFSHIMIGTNDLERAKAFYDSLLGTLGVPPGKVDRHRIFYRTPSGVFSVTRPINGEASTCANGMTIGFAAASPAQADAWHAAGIAAGGTACEEPPGVREGSAGKLYLAYLRDLDGHKLCALHRL